MKNKQNLLEKRETRTAESHVEEISDDFKSAVEKKYIAGQKEHGGRLWEKPVLGFMAEEIIDQWTYYHTLSEQVDLIQSLLEEAISNQDFTSVQQALNVLKTGNVAGRELSD